MSAFRRALAFTLRWEGGFVDDPDDPGGRTDRGISEAAHPRAWADGRVTLDEVRGIYRHDYWDRIHGDDLPDEIAIAFFDFAVQSGGAIKEVQRLVGAEPDGVVGPATIQAIEDAAAQLLAQAIVERRRLYLRRWVDARPARRKFWRGFARRLDDLLAEIA